jgi:hypothetical protein
LLQGHFSAVTALALAPDSWTLLSSSRDRTVHLWDLRTHAKLATVPIHESVEGVDAAACCVPSDVESTLVLQKGADAVRLIHAISETCHLMACWNAVDILSAGVVALPAGAAFPGMTADGKAAATAKRPIYFVTAGERGTLRIWRWAHAAAVAVCMTVQCLAVQHAIVTCKLRSDTKCELSACRSDTQRCVYEQQSAGGVSTAAGSEITWLAPLPHARGLVVATGDCRLLIFEPRVR